MIIVPILASIFFIAAVWFGLRAHDLNNAVTTQARTIINLNREILQTRAERQVAISTYNRIMNELRTDPSNPYYVPSVTPQVARHRKVHRGPEGPRGPKGVTGKTSESNAKSSEYNSYRADDGAILATTAAVATYSSFDSGSSYCDSGSSSVDSSCS